MSRYKVRLVRQGAIPQDLNLGIKLTPLVEPGASPTAPGCCNDCGSWGVTVNGTSATGFIYVVPNEDFEVVVTHLGGALCPGACIVWELRAIRIDGAFSDSFDSIAIPAGQTACDAVTFVGDKEAAGSFNGLIFALFASIAGEPFCEPLIFTFSDVCVPTLVVNGWYSLLDSADPAPTAPVESTTVGAVFNETVFPNRAFTLDFSPDVYADWGIDQCTFLPTATLSFLGGDPLAYADFSIVNTGTANAVFRLVVTGDHDYTGIQLTINPELLGYPTPPALVNPNIIMNPA